jgi:hypothetical protein
MSRASRAALAGLAGLSGMALAYGYAWRGPRSFRAEYSRRRETALGTALPAELVTDRDLDRLPEPVRTYVRRAGAVGRRHVTHLELRLHGRIRSGPGARWMTFTGRQFSVFGERPLRLFHLDARMAGIPVDVLHVFDDAGATMRVKALSLVPMVAASGPDMDRAETVTVFNDLCVLAPGALVDAQVSWRPVDDRRVQASYALDGSTVTAELVFDGNGDLVDFVSDDRLRATADGHSFIPQRWSTPVGGYRRFGNWRIAAHGAAHWHAPQPEGEFPYIELDIDDVRYNCFATKAARAA